MIFFEKNYDGESLYDLQRDISESFDATFNPLLLDIPCDEYRILKGVFKVKIEWVEGFQYE